MKKLSTVGQNVTIRAINSHIVQEKVYKESDDDWGWEKVKANDFYPVKRMIEGEYNTKEELQDAKDFYEIDSIQVILGCKYHEVYNYCDQQDGWNTLMSKLLDHGHYIASHKDHYGYKTLVEGEYNGVRFVLTVLDGIAGVDVAKKNRVKLLK